MLNPFPIQFLALFAYFILRVTVGLVFLYLGYRHVRYYAELKHVLRFSWAPYGSFFTLVFIGIEYLIGGLLVLGAYTQYATLILIGLSIKMILFRNTFDHHTIPGRIMYVLLLGIGLSLFITGAGVFAFDLPI